MSYSLQVVHGIVSQWCNLEDGSIEFAGTLQVEQVKNAIEEVNSFTLGFMQQAARCTSSEAVKVLVETSVVGCSCLLNTITRCKNQMHYAADHYKTVVKDVEKLESAFLNQLTWLREYFPAYFNEDYPLPVIMVINQEPGITQKINELKTKWNETGILAWLINTVLDSLHELLVSHPVNCTYRQLSYFYVLYNNIKTVEEQGTGNVSALINVLVRHNFNRHAFISHFLSQLQHEVADILSLPDQLARWYSHLKVFEQLTTSGAGLYPHQLSAKEVIINAIKGEITALEQKKALLADIYQGGTIRPATSVKKNSVLTSLSVSQLAVFCRLLSDCNIIQHSNQTELLKMIAGSLQTTRTLSISAESLRVKYYTPEPTAISIVKEHLHQMLSQLKKY